VEYSIVRAPERVFLQEAARLHHEALSYRSTITAFGEPFLIALYRGLLAEGLGFLIVAHEGERLCGFILGCSDSRRMMSVVPRRWRTFVPIMAPVLVRRPRLIARLAQTLFYSRKEQTDVVAELVVIAVADAMRSQGVGKQMLGVLEREFTRQGIGRYKVTVHDAMEAANRFYLQNGMQLASQFQMYGVQWNLYVRQIAHEECA
jgi:ribosomal protein S18 acetylase RimI-like enzyme